jgi:outer membrane protein TolC
MVPLQVRCTPIPKFIRSVLTAAAPIFLGSAVTASAQEPPAAVSPEQASALSLNDCLRIGRENQPSLRAAQASLAAAQTAQQALNQIPFSRLSKEIPIRKQQSAFGVAAAAANLAQVQVDVDCSVARMYFSVLYARDQKKVADQIVLRLKAVVANGETLLGKEGAPKDLSPLAISKAKGILSQVEDKLDEATSGEKLAVAGLREAMGVGPDFVIVIPEGKLPGPITGVNRDHIIRLAISMRGEVGQAENGRCVTRLEVEAQAATRRVKRPTAGMVGDMHAKPVPTGSFGDEYKPGAIGLDFPSLFVGPRDVRIERACELSQRADAVVDKARNLVALEGEHAFLRWEKAAARVARNAKAAADTETNAKRALSALESGLEISYRDVLEMMVLNAQIQASLNEARYIHAVALTELERVTAGAFAAGAAIPRPASQP